MQTRPYRTIGATLLSLLIALSFLTTGGWYCADGRSCLPALSPNCCCGAHTPAAAQNVAAEECDAADCRACLAEGECGCYQDLPALAALRSVARVTITPPAVIPTALTPVLMPEVSRTPRLTAPNPLPRPRFLAFPRDSRAPPTT